MIAAHNQSWIDIREIGKMRATVLAATLVFLSASSNDASALQNPSSETSDSLHRADTPPMGWNSWDSYGATVNEQQVKANADWMAAHLKQFGWQYITVDMEWFVLDPPPEGNAKQAHMQLDGTGRFQPAINRFPSSKDGAGFKPLADYVHSLGLKFGIHMLQGIPRKAVQENSPIAGSSFRASDAANTGGTCKWNFDNFDLKDNAAGQAYYDSLAAMYAGWGVDLIKVDCISYGPFKGNEIRMLSTALAKAGRPIVLSLSPGPTSVDQLSEVERYATMWRISNDIWDIWHNSEEYPQGVNDQFAHVAAWISAPRNGHFPDADMLPIGYLGPAPGWGKARQTRLTQDEQVSLLTLWGISQSPLMMGGDLPHNDTWTTSLLTNNEFLAVDQHGRNPRAASLSENLAVLTATPDVGSGIYVALFNRSTSKQTIHFNWSQLGLPAGTYAIRDVWNRRDLGARDDLRLSLAPHACALYKVQPH
jgi:hypothetical protein